MLTYEEQHAVLVAYLRAKVEVSDWHGVSDAANDLRVLEAAAIPPMETRRCPVGLSREQLEELLTESLASQSRR